MLFFAVAWCGAQNIVMTVLSLFFEIQAWSGGMQLAPFWFGVTNLDS
jgi:hypothetical protein